MLFWSPGVVEFIPDRSNYEVRRRCSSRPAPAHALQHARSSHEPVVCRRPRSAGGLRTPVGRARTMLLSLALLAPAQAPSAVAYRPHGQPSPVPPAPPDACPVYHTGRKQYDPSGPILMPDGTWVRAAVCLTQALMFNWPCAVHVLCKYATAVLAAAHVP